MYPRMNNIQIKQGNSYKVGMNEVIGLKEAMTAVMLPLQAALRDAQSWSSNADWFEMNEAEYKSRDGFIPHGHNLGGIQINQVIPECGQSDFHNLDYPEYKPTSDDMTEEQQEIERQTEAGEGYLDCHLRIWLKLEAVDLLSDGSYIMKFYLIASNCTEAPYFRHKAARDLFECEFQTCSLEAFKRKATAAVKRCIKAVI